MRVLIACEESGAAAIADVMSNEAIEAQAIELLVELTAALNATAKALTRVADMMDAKDEVELWSPENYKHGENDE